MNSWHLCAGLALAAVAALAQAAPAKVALELVFVQSGKACELP